MKGTCVAIFYSIAHVASGQLGMRAGGRIGDEHPSAGSGQVRQAWFFSALNVIMKSRLRRFGGVVAEVELQ